MDNRPSPLVRPSGVASVVCLLVLALAAGPLHAQAPSARQLYETAQGRDREARGALALASDRSDAALSLLRAAVLAYKSVVLRHPTSGYCDDALWFGARAGEDAFKRFGQELDRQSAISFLTWLQAEYPASKFAPSIKPALDRLAATPPPPLPSRVTPGKPSTTAPASPPATPSANSQGGFSISRQLGLRVGRVVVDPGHGGSDPGALGARTSEAAITLDIALKLEGLLRKTAGVEVVLTRRTDVYVGLQQRTAIANRAGADLFVSIHVNAHRDPAIQGVETYLLNFASTPDAAAVAARENAGSTDTMRHLDDVVKQIALTNKRDESRDLATQLQSTLVRRLSASEKGLRDLGVKQAPFVVLIGASMPSALVEVAFLTNRGQSQRLATAAYRRRLAEALSDGITRYLRALKKTGGATALPGSPAK